MLILSRVVGESLMIGDEVEIVVTKVRGNRVWLGTKAPSQVTVHRREVWEENKRRAAESEGT